VRREEDAGVRREEAAGVRREEGVAAAPSAAPPRLLDLPSGERRGWCGWEEGAGREKRGGERMIGGPRVWVVWMKGRNKGRRMREK
jgi:hypothetical protein